MRLHVSFNREARYIQQCKRDIFNTNNHVSSAVSINTNIELKY